MIVSVCVVAYNEEKVLGKLLEDIQAQDYDHEKMEILLIDSMSTDHTRDIMEKFRETEKSFLKISVFSNEKKKLAPGWNVALKTRGQRADPASACWARKSRKHGWRISRLRRISGLSRLTRLKTATSFLRCPWTGANRNSRRARKKWKFPGRS